MTYALLEECILKACLVRMETSQVATEQFYSREVDSHPFRIGEIAGLEAAIQDTYIFNVGSAQLNLFKKYLVKGQMTNAPAAQVIAHEDRLSAIHAIFNPIARRRFLKFLLRKIGCLDRSS